MTIVKRFIEANQHLKRCTENTWSGKTFGDALLWAAETHGSALAVRHADTSLSFLDLAERSLAFAAGLMAAGVQPGEKVALWMADGVEWMIARWAIPAIGAVLVPVNTRFRETELEFVLNHSDCGTLVMGAGGRNVSYLDLLRKIDPEIDGYSANHWNSVPFPQLRRVLVLFDHSPPDSMTGFGDIEEAGQRLLAQPISIAALQARMRQVKPGDVAQILYTSGTTSFPKGAQVCHGALLQNNYQTVRRMKLTPSDRYISCVPLFSATGTSYTLSMMLAGGAMIIVDRFDPELFCATVEREGITVAFLVDTIVQDIKGFEALKNYDLSSLRTGTGAPLSRDSFMFATERMGIPGLIGVYGMSETSNAVARGDCDDPFDKRCGTNGRPVDGVQMRLVDVQTHQVLGRQTVGEICIRGEVLMKGYYKQPEEDRKVFDGDGWFHTGDLGEFDQDGYLIYRGRVKEMIKPGGFNVGTLEIEHFLETFPGIRQAIVVGVPDSRLGEVAYAFVEADTEVRIDLALLKTYCKERIASYKVPRFFELVDAWPMTASQKVRKLELKKKAALSARTSLSEQGEQRARGET